SLTSCKWLALDGIISARWWQVMKSNQISDLALRRRLVKSIALGATFAVLLIIGFSYFSAQDMNDEDHPAFLRGAFEFNARLWRHLQSDTRLSVDRVP